jgi:phenylacetate-CoA ligase
MPQHRKDNLDELIHFIRKHSPYYQKSLQNLPANVSNLTDLPITNNEEYWESNSRTPNGVLTAPLVDSTVMRSGGSTGTPKIVYLAKAELKAIVQVKACALAEGSGLLAGDRIANMAHHGSLYGSFMLFNTALLELPIPIVHLPIGGNDSIDMMAHYMEVYDATVLLSNVSTTRRIAENFIQRAKTLPNLRLILYTGETFTKNLREVYHAAFPNATIHPSLYGSVDAGPIGIPARPFTHENDDIRPVYKVLAPLVVVEIIDEDGQPIQEPGVKGRLVVTHLVRRLQPLLRYPCGDIASWVDYDLETFQLHGRDSVGLKISTCHLPLGYLRGLIETTLGERETKGSQFVARGVDGTNQQSLLCRIVAPIPEDAEDVEKLMEAKLIDESPSWKRNRELGNIAPLKLEWIDGNELMTNKATGKLLDIIDERYM